MYDEAQALPSNAAARLAALVGEIGLNNVKLARLRDPKRQKNDKKEVLDVTFHLEIVYKLAPASQMNGSQGGAGGTDVNEEEEETQEGEGEPRLDAPPESDAHNHSGQDEHSYHSQVQYGPDPHHVGNHGTPHDGSDGSGNDDHRDSDHSESPTDVAAGNSALMVPELMLHLQWLDRRFKIQSITAVYRPRHPDQRWDNHEGCLLDEARDFLKILQNEPRVYEVEDPKDRRWLAVYNYNATECYYFCPTSYPTHEEHKWTDGLQRLAITKFEEVLKRERSIHAQQSEAKLQEQRAASRKIQTAAKICDDAYERYKASMVAYKRQREEAEERELQLIADRAKGVRQNDLEVQIQAQ